MSSEPESTDAPAAATERPEFKREGKQYERKRDETPIEDLFDLTKPLPKVCLWRVCPAA
jgi:hypothetical protein